MPHKVMLRTMEQCAEDMGWNVLGVEVGLNEAGTNMVAAFKLSLPNRTAPAGCVLSLACVSRNDRRGAVRFYGGVVLKAAPCPGVVLQEVGARRKHTNRMVVGDEVVDAMQTFEEESGNFPRLVKGLNSLSLSDEEASWVMLEAAKQRKLLAWSKIARVYREYKAHRERNAWTLLKAFSVGIMDEQPLRQVESLHRFLSIINAGVPASA